MKTFFQIWIVVVSTFFATMGVSRADVMFTPIVTGLDEPWNIAHFPSGDLLMAEKDGRRCYSSLAK